MGLTIMVIVFIGLPALIGWLFTIPQNRAIRRYHQNLPYTDSDWAGYEFAPDRNKAHLANAHRGLTEQVWYRDIEPWLHDPRIAPARVQEAAHALLHHLEREQDRELHHHPGMPGRAVFTSSDDRAALPNATFKIQPPRVVYR